MTGPLFMMKFLDQNPFRFNHTLTTEVADVEIAIQEYESDPIVVFADSLAECDDRRPYPL